MPNFPLKASLDAADCLRQVGILPAGCALVDAPSPVSGLVFDLHPHAGLFSTSTIDREALPFQCSSGPQCRKPVTDEIGE
jgi:hypothetical protein